MAAQERWPPLGLGPFALQFSLWMLRFPRSKGD
jgi:hypothetical protein